MIFVIKNNATNVQTNSCKTVILSGRFGDKNGNFGNESGKFGYFILYCRRIP